MGCFPMSVKTNGQIKPAFVLSSHSCECFSLEFLYMYARIPEWCHSRYHQRWEPCMPHLILLPTNTPTYIRWYLGQTFSSFLVQTSHIIAMNKVPYGVHLNAMKHWYGHGTPIQHGTDTRTRHFSRKLGHGYVGGTLNNIFFKNIMYMTI